MLYNEICQKTELLLNEHGIDPRRSHMLCGLSGGPDSIALVLVLKELGCTVVPMHCNFQLRGEESERDFKFVVDFCERHNLRYYTTRFDTETIADERGISIEMAARDLRYDWFDECLADYRATTQLAEDEKAYICVGHHADDNIETFFLNLIRGTGLRGLTGMDFCNDRGIIRPFLNLYRYEIEGYLFYHDVEYVTDSSNTNPRHLRNEVRHELIPLLRRMRQSAKVSIQKAMVALRQADDMLMQVKEGEEYQRLRHLLDFGFNMSQLRQMEQASDGAYVILAYSFRHQCSVMLTRNRGKLIAGPLPPRIGPTLLFPGTVAISGGYTDIDHNATHIRVKICGREELSGVDPARLPRHQALIDLAAVKGELYVRSVEDGDRFRPYGLKGSKLVNDYLKDRHRSRIDKAAALVVCDDEGILWLVGETIDQRAALTSTTEQAIRIETEELLDLELC